MTYQEFIDKKRHSLNNFGFDPVWMPDQRPLFPFQEFVATKSLQKGRCAGFLDTGLGKTAIELTFAYNVVLKTNRRVLILTPLAVAFQFIKEAEKMGIDEVEHSKNGKFTKKIVVANYERLHYFNPGDFEAVILDESSILKNFEGAIKNNITSFIKKIRYRFLATATPSPNDFIELGTSSEALGYLGYTDMLTRFFKNNEDTISPQSIGTKWVFKGHAKEKFFEWVSSWSISMRKPSDLGFSDEGYVLPELKLNYHKVRNDRLWNINGQLAFGYKIAKRQSEIKAEEKATVIERCEKAAELGSKYDTCVYWVNRLDEDAALKKMDKDAVLLTGSMPLEKKEDILLGFSDGTIKKLITKAKITAFGLNWQHCNNTIFFPTFSYEQYYQAIRRFWRFGQKNDVNVDLVYSEGMDRVIQSLLAKAEKANELFDNLNTTLNSGMEIKSPEFSKKVETPKFLVA